MLKRITQVLASVAALAALAAGSAAFADATQKADQSSGNHPSSTAAPSTAAAEDRADDEGDSTENVTGSGADEAEAAALEITGGGKANSVERDDENGATWEVEVTKPGGTTVDVRLDENYQVVVIEGDGE